MDSRRTIGALSVDVRLLAERLAAARQNETVTYEELSAIIGRPAQSSHGRASLMSARRQVQRDRGAVFEAIVNVGLKRLDDSGIVRTGDGAIRRMRRAARRQAEKLSCVQYDTLQHVDKVRHNALLATMAVVEHSSRETTVRQLEAKVAAAGVPSLSDTMRATLAAFAGPEK